MSVLSPPTTATTTVQPGKVRTTVKVGAAAAVATTVVAAGLHAAGVSFAIQGEMIPLAGFAQLTFVGAVIGGVLAACLRHHRFVQVTVALTALSCVPSLAWPPEIATKLSLVALHLLAAVIIVPVLARCTND